MTDEEREHEDALLKTKVELEGTVGTCSGCKGKVVWAWKNGKGTAFDAGGTPHLATCPFWAQFRKPRGFAANV